MRDLDEHVDRLTSRLHFDEVCAATRIPASPGSGLVNDVIHECLSASNHHSHIAKRAPNGAKPVTAAARELRR